MFASKRLCNNGGGTASDGTPCQFFLVEWGQGDDLQSWFQLSQSGQEVQSAPRYVQIQHGELRAELASQPKDLLGVVGLGDLRPARFLGDGTHDGTQKWGVDDDENASALQ